MRSVLAALRLLCSYALLLWCRPAFAQIESTASGRHGSLYYLVQAFVSLAIVVGLIYAIYFGLRRLSHTGLPPKGEGMQVLASQHLGGGRWVYILRVADRVLVVGGGADGLRTLAELSHEEYERTGSEAYQRGAADSGNHD